MGTRRILVLLSVAAATASFSAASPAEAKSRNCGTEQDETYGAIFRVKAINTSCKVAFSVGAGWYSDTEQRHVTDIDGRTWSCRVTQAATGTYPGLIPFSKVTCKRRYSAVRFQVRS